MADILLKQANLSEIPLRVLATLPVTLPAAGYANLLCKDTVDGKRAYLRLPDGSLVNLFTDITEIDNTITNNTTVYELSDMPAITGADIGKGMMVAAGPTWALGYASPDLAASLLAGAGLAWSFANNQATITFLDNKPHRNHRTGLDITTNQTLTDTFDNYYLNCLNSSAITLTVPKVLSLLADRNYTELEIAQNGTGTVTITPETDVTINGATASVVVPGRYKLIVLKMISINAWVAYGA